MDSYENEASKFAAQRTKLKNICEAHDLTYTFIKNSYPIKLIIRPIKGVGEQMSMLETASEDSYISPDAYLLFTMKDGVLVYRMSKTFTIEDALFGKIKNIFKNMPPSISRRIAGTCRPLPAYRKRWTPARPTRQSMTNISVSAGRQDRRFLQKPIRMSWTASIKPTAI